MQGSSSYSMSGPWSGISVREAVAQIESKAPGKVDAPGAQVQVSRGPASNPTDGLGSVREVRGRELTAFLYGDGELHSRERKGESAGAHGLGLVFNPFADNPFAPYRAPDWKPEPGMRYNAFDPDLPVVVSSELASRKDDKAGGEFPPQKFFDELGDPRNALASPSQEHGAKPQSIETLWKAALAIDADSPLDTKEGRILKRLAEQEYILQGMERASLRAAARISSKHKDPGVKIVVRPTDVSAHPGIESGLPTKPREVKNKSSKPIDLWLCPELPPEDVGAVLHYHPRLIWGREIAVQGRELGNEDFLRMLRNSPAYKTRCAELEARGRKEPPFNELLAAFNQRRDEHLAEDHEYRYGRFKNQIMVVGPFLRLKERPHENMVSDHDLFGFFSAEGNLLTESAVRDVQSDLQRDPAFQAQHGAILNWDVNGLSGFEPNIKKDIMHKHSPARDEPLIVVHGSKVTAEFYDVERDRLVSVWDVPSTGLDVPQWMRKTDVGRVIGDALRRG